MIAFLKKSVKQRLLNRAAQRLKSVFVLSTGRVGTDSLTFLLDLSPQIYAEHEPRHPMHRQTFDAYQQQMTGTEIAREYLDIRMFQFPAYTTLKQALQSNCVYAETSNRLTYMADSLAAYFPHSKFIFLHRDPAAVVRSGMRRGWYDGSPGDVSRIVPREGDPAVDQWANWSPFQKCCWNWRAVNQHAIEFMKSIVASRHFELRSEAMFGADVDRLSSMFTWIGVEPPTNDEIIGVLDVKHNDQKKGSFPPYAEWDADLQDQMWEITGSTAQQLGYERP